MKNQQQSESLFELLFRCIHLLGRKVHHDHNEHSRHHGQGLVLSILLEKKTIKQKELLDILQVRSASLSEILGKLEKQGFISRIKDNEDKRNSNITITQKGKAVVCDIQKQRDDIENIIFAVLSKKEKDTLSHILKKFLVAWKDESIDFDFKGHHRFHKEKQRNKNNKES